jgi:hypothetical protein
MFDEIDAAFRVAGRPVIFAFGDTIYNPEGVKITPALEAHEACTASGRATDVEGWWRRYMADPQFRLVEELLAHKVEFETLCTGANRHQRRFHLRVVAGKLSSPLYGRMISLERARDELRF